MATSRKRSRTATAATLFLLLILVALPAGAQSGWGDPIDEFTTGQSQLTVTAETTLQYSTADTLNSDILGSERDIELGWDHGGTREISVDVSSGTLAHNQQSGEYGYSAISWDGNDNDPEVLDTTIGLGGIDLTSGGVANRFYIWVVECDQGTTLTITVYKDSSTWWQAIVGVPEDTEDAMLEAPFSSFTTGAGTIDWTEVRAIQLYIDGTTISSMDITIDFFGPGGPTVVDLAAFTAAPANGNILVSWETGSEIGLQGFNLHRSNEVDGVYSQVNVSVIQAENHGLPIGTAYSWLDQDVVRGETYFYKLEGLEDGGLTTFFGPVSARAVHTVYLPLLVRE